MNSARVDDRRPRSQLQREANSTLADAVSAIADGVGAVVGDAFFRQLVSDLAAALNVSHVFVAEFLPRQARARTLAFWEDGVLSDNFEFALGGTPCEQVVSREFIHYSSGVQNLFPKDAALVKWDIESYLGVPLLDPHQQVLGHLALFHTQAIHVDLDIIPALKRFCERASVELERQRVERCLQESELRLSAMFESALDAIVTTDNTLAIIRINKAAEKMFGIAQNNLTGYSFDQVLTESGQKLLSKCLQELDGPDAESQQVWAPNGLTARRVTGESIPIECTISAMEIRRERCLTFILRDVNKREKAEAAINKLQHENVYLREELHERGNFGDFVGDSRGLKTVLKQVTRVAAVDTTVLITGESGTGKELVARAIHDSSGRRDALMVKVNCAALPKNLIDSELLGHERGAFTGATRQRKGRFELADQGTLFLDEVSEIPLESQAKLLRVLQNQEFERVGGSDVVSVDVRLLAATNRNLGELVAQGLFRADLYYRLNVFPLEVPPLRERREDIPALVYFFLNKHGRP